MKIMVDLDRVVFDCPSFTFWIGNMVFTKSHMDKKLKYNIIDRDKATEYQNLLFFLKMSHSKNFTEVDNSVAILNKWSELGFDINFVSSRPNFKSFQKATVEWLNHNKIKYSSLIFSCSNKPVYCKINGFDVIIDDTYRNCVDAAKLGIYPIWMRTKYNKKQTNPEDITEADNWNKIDSLVQARLRSKANKQIDKKQNNKTEPSK